MMKLLVLSITLAGAFATDVNPTCTGKQRFGHVTVSSGALTKATITAVNTPCVPETANTCFARTDGKQHFCDVTATCVADCSACTDKTIEGNKSATGGATSYTTPALAHTNNTCQVATADLCFANSAAQHFCDVISKKGCYSDCSTCTDKHTVGNMNDDGTTADATLTQSNNSCKLTTKEQCFNGKFGAGKKFFCDVAGLKACQANCDGAEPVAATSPAGTTAPGIFAALAAAVAFALRM
jgi:hypothetical protein